MERGRKVEEEKKIISFNFSKKCFRKRFGRKNRCSIKLDKIFVFRDRFRVNKICLSYLFFLQREIPLGKITLFADSPNFCNSVPLERNGLIRLNELRYWLEFIIPYENMGEERKLAPLMISIREKLMKLGTWNL